MTACVLIIQIRDARWRVSEVLDSIESPHTHRAMNHADDGEPSEQCLFRGLGNALTNQRRLGSVKGSPRTHVVDALPATWPNRHAIYSSSSPRRCPQELEASRLGRLTNRWSGRVRDKVPSSYAGARAAQLNR
jgi:hypothetical protein